MCNMTKNNNVRKVRVVSTNMYQYCPLQKIWKTADCLNELMLVNECADVYTDIAEIMWSFSICGLPKTVGLTIAIY